MSCIYMYIRGFGKLAFENGEVEEMKEKNDML
jgi:hypothetical protein